MTARRRVGIQPKHAGLGTGLISGVVMLYRIPQLGPNGVVLKEHFGGSMHTIGDIPVYVGLLVLLINLVVAVGGTILLRLVHVPAGIDATRPNDYLADADDPMVKGLDDLLDGLHFGQAGMHARDRIL
jgi:solute:Na+ symporter, SSS family